MPTEVCLLHAPDIAPVSSGWTEPERSRVLADYGILDTPREEDFDDLAKIASEVCGTPIAVVNLVDTARQFFKAEVGLGVRETPLETSFCGHAILVEDMMIVPDATKDPRFLGNPLVTGEPGLRFYAGALLKTKDGIPLGTICVLDFRPRNLDDHQISTLRLLARQAMTQMELRRSLAQKDRALEDAKRLGGQYREAVRRQRDIAREMAHRMKNTLAMVQAIVSQTFRQAGSVEEGQTAISERLAALGRAQNALISPDSDEVDILAVVEGALAPHRTGEGRFTIEGPSLVLGSQQAIGLSLGLHELATNAAKYGALSNADGHVGIRWSASEDFVFEWRETGGPAVARPTRSGFGSRLVERIVASYFEGDATLGFDPNGVVFRLECDASQMPQGDAP